MLLTAYYSILFMIIIFENAKAAFINSDLCEKTIYKDSILLFLCYQMIFVLKI